MPVWWAEAKRATPIYDRLMNPRNAWPAVVLSIAAAVIVGGMAVAKVEKDTILLIVGVLLVPVITGLLAAQGAANAQAVQAVQQQTNGHQARMLDVVERLGQLLAAASPAPQTDSSTSSSMTEPSP